MKKDYMDNKHFGKVVWAQLIGLIILGFFCAAGLVWLGVVIVNYLLQVKPVTGIVLFTCFSFTLGMGLITSARR